MNEKKDKVNHGMTKKQNLNFIFHNPNTPAESEKILSGWLVNICIPLVEQLLTTDRTEQNREGNDDDVEKNTIRL